MALMADAALSAGAVRSWCWCRVSAHARRSTRPGSRAQALGKGQRAPHHPWRERAREGADDVGRTAQGKVGRACTRRTCTTDALMRSLGAFIVMVRGLRSEHGERDRLLLVGLHTPEGPAIGGLAITDRLTLRQRASRRQRPDPRCVRGTEGPPLLVSDCCGLLGSRPRTWCIEPSCGGPRGGVGGAAATV